MGESKVGNAIKNVMDNQNPVKRDHKQEFRQYINGISSLNKEIASVNELIKTASKITKKALGKIDVKNLDNNQQDIYSSKHYIYGELIVFCWREFLEVKAEEIALVNEKNR